MRIATAPRNAHRMVVVCEACKRASCWLGIWLCDGYRTAGVISLPIAQLRELKLESPHYWDSNEL